MPLAKITKAFLRIQYREDRKWLWYICLLLVTTLAFIVRENHSAGLALLIGGMLLNTYFIAAFHERKGIDTVLKGDFFYLKNKFNLILLTIFIENIPMLFF